MSWAQLAEDITFYAFYVASKQGKTGLTVTIDVYEDTAAGTATQIVTGGSATEIGGGLYKYRLTGANVDAEGCYVAVFKTSDATVDAQWIPALWIAGKAGVENLDTTISSRNATTPPTAAAIADEVRVELATELARVDVAISTRNATTPPTAAAVADAVWDELTAGHTVTGSTGAALSAAGGAADPLLNDVPGSYPSGSAGAALGRIGSNTVTIVSPVSDTGEITLIYGDDYLYADGRALTFTGTTWPVITGGTIALIVQAASVVSLAGEVTGAAACYVSLTSTQVNSLGVGVYTYDLQVTLSNTHVVTLQQGTILVQPDVR